MHRRSPTYPDGNFPPRMRAEMAAAYVGERFIEDFLERVKSGKYPEPYCIESQKRRFWLKSDLDLSIGLAVDSEGSELSMSEKWFEAEKRERESGIA